jgi:hypothetical protein
LDIYRAAPGSAPLGGTELAVFEEQLEACAVPMKLIFGSARPRLGSKYTLDGVALAGS